MKNRIPKIEVQWHVPHESTENIGLYPRALFESRTEVEPEKKIHGVGRGIFRCWWTYTQGLPTWPDFNALGTFESQHFNKPRKIADPAEKYTEQNYVLSPYPYGNVLEYNYWALLH